MNDNTRAKPPYKPNLVAVVGVFVVCVGMCILVLLYGDLRNNHSAQVLAGVFVALAVSTILFSVVQSSAPVRTVIGLGGAALFYYLIWPEINKAIATPYTKIIRGNIYFKDEVGNDGRRPVVGASVKVANSTLPSQTTGAMGDFAIMDAPSDVRELDVYYGERTYTIKLAEFEGISRYAIVPTNAGSPKQPSSGSKLSESYLVDVSLEVAGSYWERTVLPLPDVYVGTGNDGPANIRSTCAAPMNGYVVDTTGRPGFHGGLKVGSSGGDNYHNERWDGDCFVVYAAGNNGRGSNSWAKGIEVALKKLHANATCGQASQIGAKLVYSGVNQIQLDAKAALGPCVGDDLPEPPRWLTTAVFHRTDNSNVDTIRVEGFKQESALHGKADIWMNPSALFSVALKSE